MDARKEDLAERRKGRVGERRMLEPHAPTAKSYSQNVGDDPNGPTIHCFAVGLLGQDLRSYGRKETWW